jgi:hypothetical protein
MLQHPELILWKKCPTCGYCQLDVEATKRHPKLDHLIRYDGTIATLNQREDKKQESDESPTSLYKE